MNDVPDSILYGQNVSMEKCAAFFDHKMKTIYDVMDKMIHIEKRTEDLVCLYPGKQRISDSIWLYEKALMLHALKSPVIFDEAHIMGGFRRSAQINNRYKRASVYANLYGGMAAETVWQPNINIRHVYLPNTTVPPLNFKQKLLYQIKAIKGFRYDPSSSSNAKRTQTDRILTKQSKGK